MITDRFGSVFIFLVFYMFIFVFVREWERRLFESKKQKILRIAGRIVEVGGKPIDVGVRANIDFSPTFMRKKRIKKNVS